MKSMQICIINYGMGNIHSVYNAVKELGYNPIVSNQCDEISNSDIFILPGVGAFETAMKSLNLLGLTDKIKNQVLVKKKRILGICLGMQLFAEYSEEGNIINGLSLIPGKVLDLKKKINLRVPHIGWNSIEIMQDSKLFKNIGSNQDFYFVHRYFYECKQEYKISTTNYGLNFTSAIQMDNIYGVQFHPERSHNIGIRLLKNFLTI